MQRWSTFMPPLLTFARAPTDYSGVLYCFIHNARSAAPMKSVAQTLLRRVVRSQAPTPSNCSFR